MREGIVDDGISRVVRAVMTGCASGQLSVVPLAHARSPRLQPDLNESTSGILKYLNGSKPKIDYGAKCVAFCLFAFGAQLALAPRSLASISCFITRNFRARAAHARP